MIARLSREVAEREAIIEANAERAQNEDRDLLPLEQEMNIEARKRIEACEVQLDELMESSKRSMSARKRAGQVADEMARLRAVVDGGRQLEYRSVGEWMVDYYSAWSGNRQARERMELSMRAADHQLTDDNLGVIPDPIVGPVINRIDASRPIITALGVSPLPGWNFHRPRVTQHTEVALQTDGASAPTTQKVELASQKMLIERVPVEAATYGGYVNISRQNIDFSSPNIFDIIVNDMAAQYAVTTEEVAADLIAGVATTPVDYPLNPTDAELSAAIWEAAGVAYAAMKGQGGLVLLVAPDRLGAVGPLFAPYGPQNQQGTGFLASNFGQGPIGTVAGVPVVMSAALDSGEMFLANTAAVEFYEQRVGQLSVVEPSVLGVQVAYAGYFAGVVLTAGGVVPLEEGTA